MKIALRTALALLPVWVCAAVAAQTQTPTQAAPAAADTASAGAGGAAAAPAASVGATSALGAATGAGAPSTAPPDARAAAKPEKPATEPPTAHSAPAGTAAPSTAAAAPAATANTSALGAPGGQITNTVNPVDLTNVRIGRVILGSGEPGLAPPDNEVATQVYEGVYHAPQYLPYYPTAGTIWPRAIQVPCHQAGADLLCERYLWRPEFGRAEYLFFVPVIVQGPSGAATPAPSR